MRLTPSGNASPAASLANPRAQYHQTLRSIGMGGLLLSRVCRLRRAARRIAEIAESQSGRPASPERLRVARCWLEANRRGIQQPHRQLEQVSTRARPTLGGTRSPQFEQVISAWKAVPQRSWTSWIGGPSGAAYLSPHCRMVVTTGDRS